MFRRNESFMALEWHPHQSSWSSLIWNLLKEIGRDISALGLWERIKSDLAYFKTLKLRPEDVHRKIAAVVDKALIKSNTKDFIFESEEICAHIEINQKTLLEVISSKKSNLIRVGFSFSREEAMVGLFTFYVVSFKRKPYGFGDIEKTASYTLLGGSTFITADRADVYITGKEALRELMAEMPEVQKANLIFSSKDLSQTQFYEPTTLRNIRPRLELL